jgi:hypothetical protein
MFVACDSAAAGPSTVCLEANERPLWAPGIPVYLPNTVRQSTTVSSNGRFFCSIIFIGNYSGNSGIKVC